MNEPEKKKPHTHTAERCRNIAKEVLIKKKCIIKLDVRLESYSARGSDARARARALSH